MPRTLDDSAGEVLGGHVWAKDSSGECRKIRSLTDLALFLQIFAFAAIVPYLLRLKLPRLARALEWGKHDCSSSAAQGRATKITYYVERSIQRGRPLVRPGCLTRGLTRYYFFRREGMDVALCFGMGRRDHEFTGHCWLARHGEPFLEVEDPRPIYVETYRISSAGGQAAALSGAGEHRSHSEA